MLNWREYFVHVTILCLGWHFGHVIFFPSINFCLLQVSTCTCVPLVLLAHLVFFVYSHCKHGGHCALGCMVGECWYLPWQWHNWHRDAQWPTYSICFYWCSLCGNARCAGDTGLFIPSPSFPQPLPNLKARFFSWTKVEMIVLIG